MLKNNIVISHLDEKHGIKHIHIQWPDKVEIKYLTHSQWMREKNTIEAYCIKNNVRLVYNFTGGFDIPELQEGATQ